MKHNTEHTKPFNLEHAKAGAPYCQRNGLPARIGIWDGKGEDVKLIGALTENNGYEYAAVWDTTGRTLTHNNSATLIMLPLGMCEGKPVFVGDELENTLPNSSTFIASAGMNVTRDNFRWPRKAPRVPVLKTAGFGLSSDSLLYLISLNRTVLKSYWKALDEFNGVKA